MINWAYVYNWTDVCTNYIIATLKAEEILFLKDPSGMKNTC